MLKPAFPAQRRARRWLENQEVSRQERPFPPVHFAATYIRHGNVICSVRVRASRVYYVIQWPVQPGHMSYRHVARVSGQAGQTGRANYNANRSYNQTGYVYVNQEGVHPGSVSRSRINKHSRSASASNGRRVVSYCFSSFRFARKTVQD